MACSSSEPIDARGVVVADGNSLTAPAVVGNWFAVVRDRVAPPARLAWANVAVAGKNTAQMIEQAPTRVDPLLAANPGAVHLLVAWEITNDLIYPDPGISADSAIAHLVRYAADRRAAGWNVVLVTAMPRDVARPYTTTKAEFEARRQRVNAWLRDHWREIAIGLVDVGGDPRLGEFGAELNPVYFTDGTHLTPAGQAIVADLMEPAIRAAIVHP